MTISVLNREEFCWLSAWLTHWLTLYTDTVVKYNKICLHLSSHVWLLLELITANTITPVFQAQRSTLSKHQYLYILYLYIQRTQTTHTSTYSAGIIPPNYILLFQFLCLFSSLRAWLHGVCCGKCCPRKAEGKQSNKICKTDY